MRWKIQKVRIVKLIYMLKEWYWKYLEIDKWIHFKSERKVNEMKIKDNREEKCDVTLPW